MDNTENMVITLEEKFLSFKIGKIDVCDFSEFLPQIFKRTFTIFIRIVRI